MAEMTKEHGFLSAVVYLPDDTLVSSLSALDAALGEMFENYELVLVHDGRASDFQRSDALDYLSCESVTVVHMGRPQGLESAMNAGIDCAVGDYVLEIDDLVSISPTFIHQSYALAMEGFDIVFGELAGRSAKGALFYPLLNHFSNSPVRLTSTACSLVSRRAVNRVRSISEFMPYRKAAYASCGLDVASVVMEGSLSSGKNSDLGLAVDSLALYSDAFYKIAFGFSALMAGLSLFEVVYVVSIYLSGSPVGGWTSTVFMMTLGFFGVFIVLTFILKYASLLLRSQVNQKGYLLEGVERL